MVRKEFINFSSNNYSGLAGNKEIYKSAMDVVKQYGLTCAFSRLISGNLCIHEELESKLAEFKNREACLVFQGGIKQTSG
jgi:7-keto-8-aminopelargonate synthetase-like enzyme